MEGGVEKEEGGRNVEGRGEVWKGKEGGVSMQ